MADFVIIVKPSADKALKRLPELAQRRITTAIDNLATNPRPVGATKVKGEERTYRLRIADYRVLYDIYDNKLVILVVRIAHRKDAYRGM